MTVLLSSHILAEVQQVCTSATIIGNGRMLASGRVDELLGTSTSYRVGVPRPGRRPRVLERRRLHVAGDGTACWSRPTDPAGVTEALGAAGIWLTELTPVRADLETVFLELTAGDQLGGAA